MTFFEAIQNGFRKYAEFNGRARRSEFWWWILFTALVNAALSVIPVWSFRLADGSMSVGNPLSALWGIAILLPTLAVLVRRLRDAGYGWGHAFWILAPIAGLIVLAMLCSQPPRAEAVPERAEPPVPESRQPTT